MKILNFEEIKNDFDERIFENSRADLITKLSKYPSRYIGIFRSSTPKLNLYKILHNLMKLNLVMALKF